MGKPIAVTDADFTPEVLQSDVPVLVDFWAEWCGPCKMIAPVVEELANEYDGKMKFVKLDVDTNPLITTTYDVRSIPILIFFKDGERINQVIGAVPRQAIKEEIDRVLA